MEMVSGGNSFESKLEAQIMSRVSGTRMMLAVACITERKTQSCALESSSLETVPSFAQATELFLGFSVLTRREGR